MTIEVNNLGKLAIEEEDSGSSNFGVDLTSGGSFLDLPIVEGTAEMTLETDQLDPDTLQQYIDAKPLNVLGPKRATLNFEMLLHPCGVVASDGTDSPDADDTAIVRLLKIIMGGVDANNQGTTVNDMSATASSFDVTDTTDITAGTAIGWVNSAGRMEVREVESVSGSTVTLKVAFSAAPSDSDVLYAATTVYLTENPDTSIQMKVEGVEQTDRWLLLGGQLDSIEINTELGQLPRLAVGLKFADWQYGDDAASDMTGSALSAASYANFSPVAFFDSEFLAQVVGTATRQALDVPEVSIAPNLSYEPVSSPGGVNTVARWRRVRTAPAANVSFTTYFEDFTWFDERDDRDQYHFQLQVGGAGGGGSAVAVTVPTAQITNAQRTAAGELAGTEVEAEADNDADATDESTEIRRSALRVHFV